MTVSVTSGGGSTTLDAIAAAVIGGTSLFGGRGRPAGALLGALVIGAVTNGLNLVGESCGYSNNRDRAHIDRSGEHRRHG